MKAPFFCLVGLLCGIVWGLEVSSLAVKADEITTNEKTAGRSLERPAVPVSGTESEATDVPETPLFMAFRGLQISNVRSVQIKSNHVYDYVFEKAPTDWWVQSGVWGMTNRWLDLPNYRWFGGRSEEIASIWNKRKFSGDFSMQFYFAFKEGIYGRDYTFKDYPRDVGISFCADGQNLGSGYALIVGADNNQHTVLMKQGKTVAESSKPEHLFPSYADGRPYYQSRSFTSAAGKKIVTRG